MTIPPPGNRGESKIERYFKMDFFTRVPKYILQ